MSQNNNEEYIKRLNNNIENYFNLANDDLYQKKVTDAMQYSLKAGGKHVRATLCYEFCKMCNGNIEMADAPALAIEMIHTYSLIHDDLPAMDNDDYRRGKPSCHKAFGEYTAILAGDALNTAAFGVIADDTVLESDIKTALVSELAHSAGWTGMVGGQQMDLDLENLTDVSVEELSMMCLAKTGELIKCACKMGAIAARAPQYLIDKAAEYGMYSGLAFQIVDDILDVEGNAQELGKPINSDAKENKNTFVSLLGIDTAKEKAEYYTNKALECLKTFPDNEFLNAYTKKLLIRKY